MRLTLPVAAHVAAARQWAARARPTARTDSEDGLRVEGWAQPDLQPGARIDSDAKPQAQVDLTVLQHNSNSGRTAALCTAIAVTGQGAQAQCAPMCRTRPRTPARARPHCTHDH